MKKIIKVIALLVLVNTVQAQSDRAVPEGGNSINVYYGYNVFTSFYKSVASQAAIDVKVKGIGPIGLVYEHLVTDVVGLGVELGYTSVNVSWTEDYSYFDANNNLVLDQTTVEWDFKTTRAMFRANFHFVDNEKFDCYALVSAGYRGTKFTAKASDPTYNISVSFNNPVPIGIKPGVGFRYFFTDAIGLHLELAIGTPIMGGGLSFKF